VIGPRDLLYVAVAPSGYPGLPNLPFIGTSHFLCCRFTLATRYSHIAALHSRAQTSRNCASTNPQWFNGGSCYNSQWLSDQRSTERRIFCRLAGLEHFHCSVFFPRTPSYLQLRYEARTATLQMLHGYNESIALFSRRTTARRQHRTLPTCKKPLVKFVSRRGRRPADRRTSPSQIAKDASNGVQLHSHNIDPTGQFTGRFILKNTFLSRPLYHLTAGFWSISLGLQTKLLPMTTVPLSSCTTEALALSFIARDCQDQSSSAIISIRSFL
jgi:hypothetical protein